MISPRVKFSSQADPELLAAMRQIARNDGRHFQAVLEDAMSHYIESRASQRVRPEVMAHHRASVERHRHLYELLAK
jgi:predicted transcriptional regulator